MRRAVLASLACTVVGLVGAESAAACSCAPITQDSLGRGDVAIVAKVVAIEALPPDAGMLPASIFHIRVIEVLKGEKRIRKRDVAVYSDMSTCAMDGRVGRRYGLLLYRSDHRWRGNLCGQTTPDRLRQLFADTRERAARLCGSRLTMSGERTS